MTVDALVPLLLIVLVLPLVIGILLVRDRYRAWKMRKTPEQVAAERQDLLRRLRNPEWAAIEHALGRPVPDMLKQLYADPAWTSGEEFRVFSPFDETESADERSTIVLSPATVESLARLESIDMEVFQFGTDQFGDPYGVQLFELADGDGAIYLHMLDGDSVIRVADSLADFLRWPRQRVDHPRPRSS
jgi:hypothetical protein